MRAHEEATIDLMNAEQRLRDAAEFAVGVLKHCVLDGGGCDDARERRIAIDMLTEALKRLS